MNTVPGTPLPAGSPGPLPPFLRSPSLPNPQVAACAVHDHFAIIYENQTDQLDFIVPYLLRGMELGEKSVFIVDDNSPETVIAAMEHYGIDVDAATASGALAILSKTDACLRNGDFDPDWMIGYLAQAVEQAKVQGFRAVRASGEMTWALGPAGDVFEPFFTTRQEKGTGLGLWVGRGIVQKHEGSISLRTSTRPGRHGTVLSIFLPAA